MIDWMLDRIHGGGTRPALVAGGQEYTYRDLADRIGTWTRRLRDRTLIGRAVSIESDGGADAVAAFFAAARFGNVVVPMSNTPAAQRAQLLEIAEVEYRVKSAGATSAIEWTGQSASHDLYFRLRQQEVPGVVVFSRRRGRFPQAAVYDVDRLLKPFQPRRRGVRTVTVQALDGVDGMHTMFDTFANGGLLIVAASVMPGDVFAAVARHRAERLASSTAVLEALLQSGEQSRHDLRSLAFVSCGTDSVRDSLRQRIGAAFPAVSIEEARTAAPASVFGCLNPAAATDDEDDEDDDRDDERSGAVAAVISGVPAMRLSQ